MGTYFNGRRQAHTSDETEMFDQPYTFLARHPIPGKKLLNRSIFVIAFFLVIDIALTAFFIYKMLQKKNKSRYSDGYLEVDPNMSVSLGLYTNDS